MTPRGGQENAHHRSAAEEQREGDPWSYHSCHQQKELRPLRMLPSYGSLGFARLFSDFTQIKRTHVP